MSLIDLRSIVSSPGTFPTADNASDTIIAGVHFNSSALNYWNYTLYSNGSLSNGSWCLLTFPPYTPSLIRPNGTWANVTWCYVPTNPIGLRGSIGIGFAVVFGISLVLTLVALRKHGKTYLPVEKRFYPVGRRWQWYWAVIACACALISLFTNIDVDRYFLPELPIVLTSFFWFLMQWATMAIVWEAVRHWGSWMERQFIDPDPFSLGQDDKRAKIEFWLPLMFYFWLWLNFFLIVPRNWEQIEHQRFPAEITDEAIPAATGARFKVAAIILGLCWFTTVFSLWHSIRHYKPRNRGVVNRAWGLARSVPFRFQLLLPLALAVPTYQALSAWEWAYSPLNVVGDRVAIFAGGYGPTLLIVIIQWIFGFISPNEDRELIRQRRLRGDEIDRELGLVRKPAWWRRAMGDDGAGEGMRDRIARQVREIGGGRATARKIDATVGGVAADRERQAERTGREGGAIEMDEMRRTDSGRPMLGQTASSASSVNGARRPVPGVSPYGGKSDRRRSERTRNVAANVLFPSAEADTAAAARRAALMEDGPPPYTDAEAGRGRTRNNGGAGGLGVGGNGRPGTSERSNSAETTNSINRPAQQVRSMLDV